MKSGENWSSDIREDVIPQPQRLSWLQLVIRLQVQPPPLPDLQHSSVETDHELFSMVILSFKRGSCQFQQMKL